MLHHARWIPTLLSALWPGLGQAYRSRWRVAALLAIPYTAAVVGLLAIVAMDPEGAMFGLLDPAVARGLAVALIVAGLWRSLGMLDAGLTGTRGRTSGLAVIGLTVAVATLHLGGAAYLAALAASTDQLFAPPVIAAPGNGTTTPTPRPTGDPTGPGVAPVPVHVDRLTLLFVGLDSGPGRDHALTDTMVVFSLDRATGATTAISVPRDVTGMTLYDGTWYAGKLNDLAHFADERPDEYPEGGLEVLRAELAHLVGVPIDHYAAVNLPGFERVIDLVGGVTVDNPRAIDDPTLLWGTGQRGFRLAAGSAHLDGAEALAFVRSRKGPGDNDYTRARRQQLLLLALRDRLARPDMVLALPEIIHAASDLVTTDVAASELRDLVAFGRSVGAGEFTSVVLGPPYTNHPPLAETGGLWLLRLDLPRVAALSRELFGADSRYAE